MLYYSLPWPYENMKKPTRKATSKPPPIGTARIAGESTNLVSILNAGFCALSKAPSTAPSSAWLSSCKSPKAFNVSASSPPYKDVDDIILFFLYDDDDDDNNNDDDDDDDDDVNFLFTIINDDDDDDDDGINAEIFTTTINKNNKNNKLNIFLINVSVILQLKIRMIWINYIFINDIYELLR